MIASRRYRVGIPVSTTPTRLLVPLLFVCGVMLGCGKKGPPLPPLQRLPAAVKDLSAARFADDVFLRFTVPSANVEGPGPANIARLEVYALTTTQPLTADDVRSEGVRELATLLATPEVRVPLPPPPPAEPGRPAPPPLPPGLDQGGPAVVHETLAGEALVPVSMLSVSPNVAPPPPGEEAVPGPLVAPDQTIVPRRYYFVVGVTAGGRHGAVSAPVSVPLASPTSAPASVAVTYDEKAFTLRWESAPDARAAAGTTAADGVLPSKPLRTPPPATLYDVFAVDPSAQAMTVAPVPLNDKPLAAQEFTLAGVEFGRERCFVVRAVDTIADTPVRSAASTPACVTPVDSFAPAPPRNLQAVAGAGTISLIWEDNTEADLAGYLVLRGDASGDTLAPLTPAPIREPRFDDTTAQPGVRYVYVVVAVDTASPRNTSGHSNRAEETAR